MGAHQAEVGGAASWGWGRAAAWASICWQWDPGSPEDRAISGRSFIYWFRAYAQSEARLAGPPASALRARNETEWIIHGLLTPAERNQNFRCQCQSQSQKANWTNWTNWTHGQQTKKMQLFR